MPNNKWFYQTLIFMLQFGGKQLLKFVVILVDLHRLKRKATNLPFFTLFLNFWLLPFFIVLIGRISDSLFVNASRMSEIEKPLFLCTSEPITLAIEWFNFPVIYIPLLVTIPTSLSFICLLISLYNSKSASGESSSVLI